MPPESDVRQHPDRPIVGVGVVVWRGDSFLLVRRGKEPNKGQWSIPGGAQHLGETVYAAAEREVLEETGLQVTVHGLVDVVDGIRRDSEGRVNYHYTLVDVVADSRTMPRRWAGSHWKICQALVYGARPSELSASPSPGGSRNQL
jgi:ADP-ribose pyrophosphatase YjhB (NUDIX family)